MPAFDAHEVALADFAQDIDEPDELVRQAPAKTGENVSVSTRLKRHHERSRRC